jgi:hypothetical protein
MLVYDSNMSQKASVDSGSTHAGFVCVWNLCSMIRHVLLL